MARCDRIKIITDEVSPEKAILGFKKYSKLFARIIENSNPRLTIGIFGDWGTGKTTLMRMIFCELESNKKILPVWFDAWRYEREQNLAVIPFLRTVSIALDNFMNGLKDQEEKNRWSRLNSGIKDTFNAYIKSTKLSINLPFIQIDTDLEKMKKPLKLKADPQTGNEDNTFVDHSTGFLKQALDEMRGGEIGKKYRIVAFIDDLDRCTPLLGLEVLESVKSFFDMEGMIYVIGMNHATIDPIIEEKYKSNKSNNKPVTGLDYMKKIVQLPFHIPKWSKEDIETFVRETINNEIIDDDLKKKLEKASNIIIQAIDANPREAKRVINSVILSKEAFDTHDDDFQIEQLIIVNALKFRTEWNAFLDFVTDKDKKDAFCNAFLGSHERLTPEFPDFAEKARDTINRFEEELEQFYRHKNGVTKSKKNDFEKSITGDFETYFDIATRLLNLWPDCEIKYKGFLFNRNPLSIFLSTEYDGEWIVKRLLEIKEMKIYLRALDFTSDSGEQPT